MRTLRARRSLSIFALIVPPYFFFASDLLIRITNTLTLIRLGRTERANVSSDLANLLLVDTANHNFRIGRSFSGNTLGQLILDRMGKTQGQVKLLTLRLRTVTYARQLQLTLPACGYAGNHVVNQRTSSTSKSAGLFGTIACSKAKRTLFLLYFNRLVNGELKRSLGALHIDFLSVQLDLNTGRQHDRIIGNPGHVYLLEYGADDFATHACSSCGAVCHNALGR